MRKLKTKRRRKGTIGSAGRTRVTQKVKGGDKYQPGQEVIFIRWRTEERISCRVEFVDENGYVMLQVCRNPCARYLTDPKHIA